MTSLAGSCGRFYIPKCLREITRVELFVANCRDKDHRDKRHQGQMLRESANRPQLLRQNPHCGHVQYGITYCENRSGMP